tara:strand:+ start:534 stop:803 length:270 start_codon:yes stop_codon:yes gene_type:complete
MKKKYEECEDHVYDVGVVEADWGVVTYCCINCGITAVLNFPTPHDTYGQKIIFTGETAKICRDCERPHIDDNPNGVDDVCYGDCPELND